MKAGRRAVRRALFVLAALVLAAGLAAPFLRANRLAGRIRSAIEQGLGRRVEIGEVRFNLFTGPGFTMKDVVIHEDPAVGIEPLAYVGEMDARVGLWSLLAGRLEFSTLRLIEPSVNLAKPDTGSWNLQPLLARAAASARSPGARMPALEVRGGRFNFRFGDLKSVFYLSNADVDITPTAGAAEFRVSGEPARTDRGAQGFGRLVGRGRWRPAADPGQELELVINLERSNVGEIVRLFHGSDVGLHGLVASRATVTGPLSDIRVTGRLQLEDVHRWDLMPYRGREWPLDYRGRIDLAAQTVELETVPPPGQALPVSIRFRAADLLTEPRWAVLLTVRELPMANVVEVARHFGAALPKTLTPDGRLEGAIGFGRDAGLQGLFLVRGLSLAAPEAPALTSDRVRIEVDGNRIHAGPFTLEAGADRAAQVEADFRADRQSLEVLATTRGLATSDLRAASERMFGAPPIPLLAACQQGQWCGWVRYRRQGETGGEWSGSVELRDARPAVEGLAEPLLVRSASVQIDGPRLALSRIRAQAGKIAFEGEFRREGVDRPDRLRISIPEASAAEIERVLAPTLRRQRGLLARTLRLVRGDVPDWLDSRRADLAVGIGVLTAEDLRWEKVRLRLIWRGAAVDIAELTSAWSEGALKAIGSISLAAPAPVYRLQGRLRGFAWRGAKIDVNGKLETAGSGAELFQNLRSNGTLSTADLPLLEDAECLFAKGRYDVSVRRGAPRLKLTSLKVALDDEIYLGQGSSLADGRVAIDLVSEKRELRLVGRLAPFRFEPVPAPEKK
jgi:hypothetical protein